MKSSMFLCACLISACVDPASGEETSETSQAATAVHLDGQFFFQTDHFTEYCGSSTLVVRTSWGTNSTAWTNIPRGDVTYVKPAQAGNGSFEWHCGNPLVNGIDFSECNDSPANWVRIWWDPNGRSIDMRCYNICGDGSSAADCAPF